ncbi:MAG: hypothetical protein AAFR51_13080 [Pseudomonadota bacterium]
MSDLKLPSNGALLSIIAIFISLSALGVSVFEVTSLKDQQRASVWPYLDITQNYSSEGFKVTVTNKGIGPALLGDVSLFYGDQNISSSDDLDAIIREVNGPERAFSYDTYMMRIVSEDVLSPGEEVVLFGVPWTPDTRTFIENVSPKVRAEGCYCSVYDQCWAVDFNGTPRETKACR